MLLVPFLIIALSVLLLYKNFPKNKNSIYISGFLISLSLPVILHYVAVFSDSVLGLAIFFGHIIPVFYLAGPCFYFYVRNTLRNSTKLDRLDFIHFVPFVISLISIFPYYFQDFNSKLANAKMFIHDRAYFLKVNISWLYPSIINSFLRPFFLLGYSIVCFVLLYRFIRDNKSPKQGSRQDRLVVRWLLSITIIITLLSVILAILTLLYFYNPIEDIELVKHFKLNYMGGVLFSLIPVFLLAYPEILYGLPIPAIRRKQRLYDKEKHERLEDTAQRLLDFVKKEENILNPNFSIDDICLSLNLKKQEVRYCFNEILKIKLVRLKKELRVEYAKKELKEGKLSSFSMEGIWTKSGFTSRTSFFVAFKEVTGMTPLGYLKTLEKTSKKA